MDGQMMPMTPGGMMGGGMGGGMMSPAPPPAPEPPPIDLERLAALIKQFAPPPPRYPAWYTKPPKPDAAGVAQVGRKRFEELQLWRKAVATDLSVLRLDLSGIFKDDRAMYDAGIIDEYASPALIADFNLACALISGIDLAFIKPVLDDKLTQQAADYAEALAWLRDEEVHRFMGDMDQPMAETKVYLAEGLIAKRRMLDTSDPDYPVPTMLLDPATLVPEWETNRGLRRLWRIYRTRVSDLALTYGDFTESQWRSLVKQYGKEIYDNDSELAECVEYLDRNWRCIVVGETVILPPVETLYGEVPVTMGYGPLGEPSFISYPHSLGKDYEQFSQKEVDRTYQSVGYVRYAKESHLNNEALMRRALFGVKASLWPTLIREATGEALNRPQEEIDLSPGVVNETTIESKVSPLPRNASPVDIQLLMQQFASDRLVTTLPPSSYGINDKSNVTGTAIGNQTDAGFDKVAPWVAGLARFHERDAALFGRMWRNWGHMVGTDDPKKPYGGIRVPRKRQRQGEAPAFDLTPQLIDAVGPRIKVHMVNVRKSDLLPIIQAGGMAIDRNLATAQEVREKWMGMPGYERMFDEWREEYAIRQALDLPEFAKLAIVPMAFLSEIEEAAGNPEKQQLLAGLLEKWMMLAEQSMAPPPQMGPGGPMPPQQGGPMPPQQAGGPPGPPPGSAVIPPTSAGVSMPDLGVGPGSQGAPVGRPPF